MSKTDIYLVLEQPRTQLTLRIGGVPFLIFSSSVMIFRSFLSSGDKLSSSTSTSSLSKYCMSSGFIVGRLPFGCRSTTCVLLSGVCIRNPTGVPASGVGVAVSLRAGVRIGTYPAGGCRTYSTNTQQHFICF